MSIDMKKMRLASMDEIIIEYNKIYHNKIFKEPFDYEKLKGTDKFIEDAVRTAFFSGFHKCEEVYEIYKLIEMINSRIDDHE